MDANITLLWQELCNSMMIYSMVAGVPRMLHIPDIVKSAYDRDDKQLTEDLENLIRNALQDSTELLIENIKDEALRSKLIKSMATLKAIKDPLIFKDKCTDFIGYLLDELGHKEVK